MCVFILIVFLFVVSFRWSLEWASNSRPSSTSTEDHQGFLLESPGAGTICFRSIKHGKQTKPYKERLNSHSAILVFSSLKFDTFLNTQDAHHKKSCCSYAVKEVKAGSLEFDTITPKKCQQGLIILARTFLVWVKNRYKTYFRGCVVHCSSP